MSFDLLREILEKDKKWELRSDISGEELTTLEGIKFVYMQKLDASHNKLKNLKGCPKDVTELNFSYNSLTSLEGICDRVGDLDISFNEELKSLKGIPKYIGGSLNAHDCGLTTLEGGPEMIAGACSVASNKLTSLRGSPREVGVEYGGSFIASFNALTSLEHAPLDVHGDVYFDGMKITSLEGIGKRYLKQVNGKLHIDVAHVKSHALGLLYIDSFGGVDSGGDGVTEPFDIINKWVKQARGNNAEEFIIDCQHELIEAGYEELAQL